MQWTQMQQRAIDLRGRSLLVSAAAGSGKTTVMVERILSLALEGVPLDRMLIVTFTRAAASSMREKLTKELERRMQAQPHNQVLRRQSEALRRADISTYSSFLVSVLRQYYYLLNIPPDFKILDQAKLARLENDLQSGKLVPAAAAPAATPAPGGDAPAKAEAPAAKPAAKAAPAPKAAPLSGDAKAIWDKALQDLAKNEPPLYGLLRKERFIGAKGTVYQVLIPASKKEFSYVRLNQQARRDRIAKALSDAAGTPLTFEAVLEQNAAEKRMETMRDEAQRTLIEAFGRDLVQIDEGEKP